MSSGAERRLQSFYHGEDAEQHSDCQRNAERRHNGRRATSDEVADVVGDRDFHECLSFITHIPYSISHIPYHIWNMFTA